MSFSLKIEAQILLSHWDRHSRTFRHPSIALKLSRSRNLHEQDPDRLPDVETENAINLMKENFTQQIAVTVYNKIFSHSWNSPTLPRLNQETGGWVVEENNMFQHGSRASAVFELPARSSHITTHHARTVPTTPCCSHHKYQHQRHPDQPIHTSHSTLATHALAPSLNTNRSEERTSSRSRQRVHFDIQSLPVSPPSAPRLQPAPPPSVPCLRPAPLPPVPRLRPAQASLAPRLRRAPGPSVRSPIVIVESETETSEEDSEQDNRRRNEDADTHAVSALSQDVSMSELHTGAHTNTQMNDVFYGAPPPYHAEPGTPVLQGITGVQGTYSVTINGVVHLMHIDRVRN
ncbi:uncharacterized protein HD556DRAFT_1445640 [Suillus plorans]|uniref:Uncharacterized protein n=1 Tax=Suillus plorans TaxID=116603 RepID=A0A9P7AK49_9AGAM|nr:uncharacterized protein HD556DRAFT_1445640 [Suillus plorans]KAG1791118.1 hypothetical protein HD556DRAFT_1445640 [Suillus plorans]